MNERTTQQRKILRILAQGKSLNPINARSLVPTLSLSQNVGRLIAKRWPIKKGWTKLSSGVRVRSYWLPEACK